MEVTIKFDTNTPEGRTWLNLLAAPTAAEMDQLLQKLKDKTAAAAAAALPEGSVDTAKANRQAAAANARAAKAAKTQPSEPSIVNGDTMIDDDTGSADLAGPAGTNGQGQDADDLGLDDPSMSPTEARDKGLAVVREIYAAGKVAEVKSLQKEYGVAKFYDVPPEKGHAFYRRVMEVAHQVGLRA